MSPSTARRPPGGRSYVVVSTYPPTACGIATFSAALCEGLEADGAEVSVVRAERAVTGGDARVVGTLDGRDHHPAPAAIASLNAAEVVIVQHEYGIYGGFDGDAIVRLLHEVDRPVIVVAHTVLHAPTHHQRSVLEAVADAADAVVVMTEAGRVRLGGFDVDPRKVTVIPHGAAVPTASRPPVDVLEGPLLTWGLLGPGKGIEWAIDALARLEDIQPRVHYRIAGDTHPKVAALDGETYREMLSTRAARAGLSPYVHLDPGYRDLPALSELISTSSVVVLPYDSPDQVTSGVLVDAVAAGRPVVATAFPHAVELLASGAGLVVPREDPDALAGALRRVLTEPGLAHAMAVEARRLAPGLAWPAVAARYRALGDTLLAERAVLSA